MLQLYGHFQENHGSETNHSSPKEKKRWKLFSYLTTSNISLKKNTQKNQIHLFKFREMIKTLTVFLANWKTFEKQTLSKD